MRCGPRVWCSRDASPGCTLAPWSPGVALQKAFSHTGCRVGLHNGNREMWPFCSLRSITWSWKSLDTQINVFHCLTVRKMGFLELELITFRRYILSIGGPGSLSERAADSKMVYNLWECLCLFPALHFPQNSGVPRGVQFPTAIHQAQSLSTWNWFCRVN